MISLFTQKGRLPKFVSPNYSVESINFLSRSFRNAAIIGILGLLFSPWLAMGQCNVVTSGTAAAPTCSNQALSLGAGQSYNISYTNGVFYQISYSNNAQSNGYCINGTQYTANPGYFNTLSGTLATGIFRNTGTWSGSSAVLNYSIATPTVPGTPSVSTNGCNQVTLTWGASSYAQGYELQVATDAGFVSNLAGNNCGGQPCNASVSLGSTSAVITGLTPGTTYYARVRATNGSTPCRSGFSGTLTFTPPANPSIVGATPSPAVASGACAGSAVAVNSASISGGVGCSLQYRFWNGTSWSGYSGTTSYTSVYGGDLTNRIEVSTTGCSGTCATPAAQTYTWSVVSTPIAPTLTSASPANGTSICAGYNSGTVTMTAGSGGASGAAGEYQVSINNGSSWASYTNGAAINTTGASGNVIIQARRTAGTPASCAASSWTTLCTWPVASAVVGPTLSSANPASGTVICAGFNTGTVTCNAGSGGSSGAADQYRVSIDGGSTWSAYTNGAAINTSSATGSVIVQSSRTAGSYGCTTSAWTTMCTWTLSTATVNPTLNTASPVSGTSICPGYNGPSATINAGSGGSAGAADSYQFSINGGGAWSAYTSGGTINTTGATTSVQVRASRSAGSYGCSATGPTVLATWPIIAQPVAPTLLSSSASNGSTICAGYSGTVTCNAGTGGTTGAVDQYQVSINGGGAYSAYTNGAAINTTGATGSVIVQSRRVDGTLGCSTTAWTTVCTWTVGTSPVSPTLSVASPVSGSTICAGFNTGTVTCNAGSGGSSGAADQYRFSINGGSTWNTYTNGSAITTTGATGSVIVQASRTAGSFGCTTTAWTTVCTWTVGATVVNPTLSSATPASGTTLCIGYNGPLANITAGSGGSTGAADSYQFSINGGGAWSAYTSGSTINTSGGSTSVQVRASRSAGSYGCTATGPTVLATWPLAAQPVAPTLSSATPSNGTTICEGTAVSATGTAGSGGTGSATNEFRFSIDNGATWSTYTNGASIATLGGTTAVIVQSRRVDGTFGCTTTAWGTIASWPMNIKPSVPTFTSTTITGCGLSNITPTIGANGNTCRFYGPNSTSTLIATGTSYTASIVGTNTYYVTTYNSTTGCESDQVAITVTITSSFTVVMTSTQHNGYEISCYGGSNGDAIATLTGGSPVTPVTYYWSNGTTNSVASLTNTITGLQSATFNVTAIDNVGCGGIGSISLDQPTELAVSLSPSDYNGWEVSCNGASDGSVNSTVTGGSGGNTFSWTSSPSGFTSAAEDPTGMSARSYTVVVTNNNGCTATGSVTFNQPSAITFSTLTGYACSGNTYTSADVTVNPVGGASTTYQYRYRTPPTSGVWSAWQSANNFPGLSNGTSYEFQVRDAVNTSCTSSSTTVAITFPASGTAVDACNFIYVSPGGATTYPALGQKSCTVDLPTAIQIYNNDNSRNHILMQSGNYTYTNTITIPAGLTIDGGYTVSGADWIKSTGSSTIITMNPTLFTDAGTNTGHHIAFRVGGNNVTVKDITVTVLPAGISGSTGNKGKSIYGFYLSGQTGFTMTRCSVTTTSATAGDAGATLSGSGGGGAGGAGGAGNTTEKAGCSECGGSGATGSAGNGGASGGGGGAGCCSGGCNWYGCDAGGCNASSGGSGSNGAGGTNYTAGNQPSNTGGLSTYYIPVNGVQGGDGFGGGGGGGGGFGASGTCCTCDCGPFWGYGGNGGAGGAGGSGGNFGYGGGSSFCVYAWGGSGTITDCVLNPGAAGAGGSGQNGRAGVAGSAGSGGTSNAGYCDGGVGGNGGTGGTGGNGGRGQDGATGISAAVQNANGATVTRTGTTIPADGTVTVNWYKGCRNSQIDITKTSGSSWTGIGTDPLFVNNLTSSTSSYSASSNSASIYFPTSSSLGNKNISLGSTTLTSFIRLIGDRLNTISSSTLASTVIAPTCPTSPITLATNLTSGQMANITQYDWDITLVSTPTVNVFTSTSANPGSVPPPSGDWIEGATYQVRFRAYEVCCGWSTPAYFTFTMANNLASVATITQSTPATVCANTTRTYTASAVAGATTYNWTVSGGVIQSGQGTQTITVLWGSAGTGRTVSVYPSNSCAAFNGSPTTITREVHGAPTVSITGSGMICTSGTLNLVASATSGVSNGGSSLANGVFTYSWPSPGSGTAQTYTASAAGTYSVIVTEGGTGCTATNSTTLTNPPALVAGSHNTTSETACQGYDPISLTVSGTTGGLTPYAYQWQESGNNISGQTATSYDPPVLNTSGTYNYRVRITDACGTQVFSTVKAITIVNDPSVTVSGTLTYCVGQTATLTATPSGGTGTTGLQWQTSPDGISSWSDISGETATTFNPSTAASGTFYYRVKVTATGSSCTDGFSSAQTMVVNASSIAPTGISGITTLCGAAASTTLTATGGTLGTGANYQWGTGATVGSNPISGATSISYTVTPGSTTTYWVRIENNSSPCSATTAGVTQLVTVNTASVAPTSISGTTSLCGASASTTLTAIGGTLGTGANYQWGTGSTVGSNPISGATSNTYTVTPGTTETYWVRIENTSSPCTGNTSGVSQLVTVSIPSVDVSSISGSTALCGVSASTTLTANGATLGTGANYQWGTGAVIGANPLSGETNSTLTVTPGSSTTYWVRIENNSSPCSANTAGLSQLVSVGSPATANAGSNATICTGETYTLTGASVGGSATTGSWSISSVTGTMTTSTAQLSSISATASPNLVTFTPTSGTNGTVTLTLTTDDPAGPCAAQTSTVTLTVNPSSVGGSVSNGGSVCLGGSTGTLNLTGHTGSVIKWQKRVNAGSWSDIPSTSGLTSYSETPSSAGIWEYRAEVQNSPCSAVVYSNPGLVNVDQNTVTGTLVSDYATYCLGGTINFSLSGHVGGVVIWQESTDGGATWNDILGTDGLSSGSGTASTAGNFSYRIEIASGSCPSVYSNQLDIVVDASCSYTWLGTIDNNWHNGGNWSGGIVPLIGNDIIIPDQANDPIVSTGNAECKNLDMASGATLTVSTGYNLDVAGTTIIFDGNTIQGGGKISFTSNAATSVTVPVNFEINRVHIEGTTNVTLTGSGQANMHGILKINGTLQANNKMTFISNASGTGLVDGSGSGGFAGGPGSVVTVQRQVFGSNGYRYISAAVSGCFVSDWSDDFGIVGVNNFLHNGINFTSPWPTLWRYDESVTNPSMTYGWYSHTDPSNVLDRMKGYAGIMSGTVLDLTGSALNGTQNTSITNTSSGQPLSDGWNLMGNPYISPINFNAVYSLNSGIAGTVYYWTSSGTYSGQYATYNALNGLSTNGGSYIIPSSQGFFVKKSSPGSQTFTLNNTVRTTDLNPTFYKMDNNYKLLRLEAEINGATDELVIYEEPTSKEEYEEKFDSWKFMAFDPSASNIYSIGINSEEMLSVNALPKLTEGRVIPIGYKAGKPGFHVFKLTEIQHFENQRVYLEDKKLGIMYDLGTNLKYEFTQNPSDPEMGRFYLKLGGPINPTPINAGGLLVNLYDSENGMLVQTKGNLSNDFSFKVVDISGKLMLDGESSFKDGEAIIELNDVAPAMYFVTVEVDGQTFSGKMIKR